MRTTRSLGVLLFSSTTCLLGAACAGILGDFEIDPSLGTSGGVGEGGQVGDGSGGGIDAPTGTDGGQDANIDGSPDGGGPPVVPLNVATNLFTTCATVGREVGTPQEKRATFCWGGEGLNDPSYVAAAANDPRINGFVRPHVPNTSTFPVFDQISGAGNGSWMIGRSEGSFIPYVWGGNDQTQAGFPQQMLTVPLTTTPTTGAFRISFAAAANYHGCMISAGKLYCWGQNNNCEVTSGKQADCAPGNQFIGSVQEQTAGVIGGAGTYEFERFTGGFEHSCVVQRKISSTEATVTCWGSNLFNQTGQSGSFVESPSVVSEVGSGVFGDFEIGAGAYHTCAIFQKASLHCWGRNDKSQSSPGAGAQPVDPQTISLPSTQRGQLRGLALGGEATCYIVEPATGGGPSRAACFGEGPLGRIPAEQGEKFAFVAGIKDVVKIVIAANHACAIARGEQEPPTNPHALFCWGSNSYKQVDPNDPQQMFQIPHRVSLPTQLP